MRIDDSPTEVIAMYRPSFDDPDPDELMKWHQLRLGGIYTWHDLVLAYPPDLSPDAVETVLW